MAHIDPWARIDITSLERQIYKVAQYGVRDDPFMAMLQKKGGMKYNVRGKGTKWRAEFRQLTPQTGGDMTPTAFPRTNVHKEASLPQRTFNIGEAYSKFEKLACNTSDKTIALVNWLDELVPRLTKAMTRWMRQFQVFQDGHATGSENLHGIQSWIAYGAAIANSLAVTAADTYGSLNTAQGSYGGGWTAGASGLGGWPNGANTNDSGDFEYAFWTPMILDYQNTNCRNATKTWINTWREILTYGNAYLFKLRGKKPDAWILESEMLRQTRDTLADNERVLIGSEGGMAKLGFSDISYEGVELATTFGMPSGRGMGLIWDSLEMWSMQPQLFGFDRDKDISTGADFLKVDFFGNMRIDTPANFVWLAPVS